MASSLKWNFLRSTWKWYLDEHQRLRLARLVGSTAEELDARFSEYPEDALWQPSDVEARRVRLRSRRRRR